MMSKPVLQGFRKELLALRDRVDANFTEVRKEAFRSSGGESAGGLSNAPLHLGDLGSQEFDAGVTLALAENEATLRQEIEDALDRIRTGEFGECENCGQAIPKERLKIVPYARHCVPCAEKLQPQLGT